MGEALSKPCDEWLTEEEVAAAAPEPAPEQPLTGRRVVKVTPARLKPAGGGDPPNDPGPAQPPALSQPQQEQRLPTTGAKRKAEGPADGDGVGDGDTSASKRHQLLGLTMLTLGVLQGMAPFARPASTAAAVGAAAEPASPAAKAAVLHAEQPARPLSPPQQQQQQRGEEAGAADGPVVPALPVPAAAGGTQEAAAEAAAMAWAPGQEVECLEDPAPPRCSPLLAVLLSAAKPVSRLQLRQQLQLRTQRPGGPPAVRSAGRVAASPGGEHPAASAITTAARCTRGQRLLGLARQQQHASAVPAAPAAAPPGAVERPADQSEAATGMDVDSPLAPLNSAALPAEPAVAGASANLQLAQRCLTQSLCGLAMAGAAADEDPGSCQDPVEPLLAAEASLQAAAAPAAGECTPSRPPPAALSTPTIAEPGSALRPAQAAISPARACGSPAPSGQEGDVEAALHQVGQLIADLRGGSPQPPPLPTWQRHGALAAEPADPAEHEQEEQLQEQEEQLPEQGEQLPAAQLPEAQLAGDVAGDGNAPPPCLPPPCSPPEVSSKPREDGADNFPGFWRPPAAEAAGTGASGVAALAAVDGKGSRKRAAGSATGEGAQALQRQRQPSLDGGDEQMTLRGQGRSRRVRFSVPDDTREEDQPQVAAAAPAQQEPVGPLPLLVAPPVLPSGGGRSAGGQGRPLTPAKPAALPMPQPPAYSRFGAASFHRPYGGPQGRRQALLSFVSDSGATCFALPPVPPGPASDAAEAEAGEGVAGGSPAGPSAALEGEVVIPRRLQHRQGLGRRLSLQPVPPAPQGPELLAQELREAFLNAKLADHAGEPWARLDVAGCELKPGGGHADALRELSARVEEQRGGEAVQRLLGQLDAEWQHLEKVRRKYVQGAASAAVATAVHSAAAAASPPAAKQGAAPSPAAAAVEEDGRPRSILKHKSSFNGEGQAAGTAEAAAAVAELAQEQEAAAHATSEAAQQAQQAAATLVAAAATVAAAPGPAAAASSPETGDAGETAIGFEAILAAAIVQEELLGQPDELAPGPPATLACPAPPALAVAAAAEDEEGPQGASPMELDAPADAPRALAVAQPEAEAASTSQQLAPCEPAAAEPAPAAEAEPAPYASPALAAEATEALEAQAEPLSPRPVELTPGPSLSRGQKMLARLGTPVPAGKLQQLLAGAPGSAEQGGRQASALFASPRGAATLQLQPPAVGWVPRRPGGHMSRGERLLATLKSAGSVGGSGSLRMPAGAGPASAAAGLRDGEAAAEDEGPTVHPAAAVLL